MHWRIPGNTLIDVKPCLSQPGMKWFEWSFVGDDGRVHGSHIIFAEDRLPAAIQEAFNQIHAEVIDMEKGNGTTGGR